MTEVTDDPGKTRRRCDEARAAGHRVGFVPTMGALHDGHLALIRHARECGAQHLVLSIFVNPLQFGVDEDFERYPRALEEDLSRCKAAGVDLVFAPRSPAMYPSGFQTQVEVGSLTERLEGVHRPGHFRGVTTVVAKLFHIVGPCIAVFGRKDYQQWKVIERMVADLHIPVEVVGHPTIREPDGLALSSRNAYLSPVERERARAIPRGLRHAQDAWNAGERGADVLGTLLREPIEAALDRVDYASIVHPDTLEALAGRIEGRALAIVAAHVGATRLIDNAQLGEDGT